MVSIIHNGHAIDMHKIANIVYAGVILIISRYNAHPI
jgi:hypothetical protein